jgi:hypothetical protein
VDTPASARDTGVARDVAAADVVSALDLGGPPGPCRHQLCESFESYAEGAAPDPAIWARTDPSIVVGSARAARGSKALHIPPFMAGMRFIREKKTFPAPNGFYGRAFFWIERQPIEPPPEGLYHWTVIEAGSHPNDNGGPVLRLGGHLRDKGVNYMRFNFETHGMGETGLTDTKVQFDPKVWHCVEWYFNTTTNEARFWWNGQERTALHWQGPPANQPQFTFPTLAAQSFGWAEYQVPATPWEIWIDELAIDTQRIGCDG